MLISEEWRGRTPGLGMALLLGCMAMLISSQFLWLGQFGLSILTIAILLGFLFGNIPGRVLSPIFFSGFNFAKQKILRLGIILFGFRLTFTDIASVGMTGILIDLLIVTSTFCLTWIIGVRFLGMDRVTAMLIGSGCSICGAAAILATQPILQAQNDRVTIAISTIVIFGTIGIFLYPAIFLAIRDLNLFFSNETVFGIYIGSTIHEVAQVVAASGAISEDVTGSAVITKMIRVMMLGPFLLILSSLLAIEHQQLIAKEDRAQSFKSWMNQLHIPWFAVWFIVVICFNSFVSLPTTWIHGLVVFDNLLLAMAMAALGMSTQFQVIVKAGLLPLQLAAIIFIWLLVGGALINWGITVLLSTDITGFNDFFPGDRFIANLDFKFFWRV